MSLIYGLEIRERGTVSLIYGIEIRERGTVSLIYIFKRLKKGKESLMNGKRFERGEQRVIGRKEAK